MIYRWYHQNPNWPPSMDTLRAYHKTHHDRNKMSKKKKISMSTHFLMQDFLELLSKTGYIVQSPNGAAPPLLCQKIEIQCILLPIQLCP